MVGFCSCLSQYPQEHPVTYMPHGSTSNISRQVLGKAVKSLAVGFCVFAFASTLATWLTLHNVHGILAFADNILAGIASGIVVLFYERWRQHDAEKKMRTIRLMNHHVRNALQIIAAASECLDGTVPTKSVRSAVNRIEWALREVLARDCGVTDPAPNSEVVSDQIDKLSTAQR